ncbi:MATE family efflux transporter [Lutimaribacter marinistellae]|uniref:MATE family efflux transporter n=1 Tax=Lutimaribacter marinistellae TaxID=1820329 RepID=A0ABV7THQ9_9RHOB
MSDRGRFLTGSTMGHVVRMTMTGAMGITFVFLVDAANLFWISRLGEPVLMAAIGFAFAIQFFSVSAGIGLMIASTALVSRHIGAGDRALARRTATSAAIIACLVQTTAAVLIILFRHDIVRVAGATGETADLAARYLAMSVPSLGIMAVAMIANGTLRAEGDGRRSMMVTLTSGSVAMIVDPFLIVGLEMGLDGAALGLNLSRCVMLVQAFRFAVGTHDLMARPSLADVASTLRPYLAIAVPAILAQQAAPVGNYLLTTVMAGFGDEAMAGWAVVGRLTVVAFGGVFSLAGAIGGIFGQNYGAREYARLRSTYRDALVFGFAYTLVTWTLLAAAGPYVISGFGLEGEGAQVVRSFVMIGAGSFVFAAALFVANSAFNALGRPAWSTLASWTRDGVLTWPAAIWLAAVFGSSGVIYAQALVAIVAGVTVAWLGWRYVCGLERRDLPALDLEPPRPYAHADRFRRR